LFLKWANCGETADADDRAPPYFRTDRAPPMAPWKRAARSRLEATLRSTKLVTTIGIATLIAACAESASNAAGEASRDASGAAELGAEAPVTAEAAASPFRPLPPPPLALRPATDAPAAPEAARLACDDVLAIANAAREAGGRFFAVTASSGAIAVPDWRSLDAASNTELVIDGLYDGWCEEPARTNDATGAPLTDDERAACHASRKAGLKPLLKGAPRLDVAMIDVDRDGDEEKTYQLSADPAIALTGDRSWTLWNLQPRIFVSAEEDPETHRQLHRTLFAPEASLFFREGELFALRAWNGMPDRYEIFLVRSAAGRLGQIPLCELTAAG
jgi:hypothetical protein